MAYPSEAEKPGIFFIEFGVLREVDLKKHSSMHDMFKSW